MKRYVRIPDYTPKATRTKRVVSLTLSYDELITITTAMDLYSSPEYPYSNIRRKLEMRGRWFAKKNREEGVR